MSNTVGIKLDGDILLGTFADVLQKFDALLRELTTEIAGPDSIHWQIVDLRPGSAHATVQAIPTAEIDPTPVLDAYRDVSRALAEEKPVPYSTRLGVRANELLQTAEDGSVSRVRFYVSESEVGSTEPAKAQTMHEPEQNIIGVVEGRLEGLARRPRLRIILYDDVFDRQVRCWPEKDQFKAALRMMGRRIRVSGRLTEDPEHGWVTDVRQIWKIEPLEERKKGQTQSARGILPWRPGDEPAEVAIRRLRDAT